MLPVPEKKPDSFSSLLKEETERLHLAMIAGGLGIWEMDPITHEVIWDDRCREFFGIAKDNKLPYDQAIRHIHPEDLEKVNIAVAQALSGEDHGRYDIHYRTIGADDKKLRWVHFSGQAYFDEDGKVTRFSGIAQDITEYTETLLRSEMAVNKSESRLQEVISSAPAGIGLFVGKDLIIDMPNQVFIDIIGRGPGIVGKPLHEVMPELHNQPFLKILNNVYASGTIFRSAGSPINILKNGVMTTSFYNITFSPLFDKEGKVYAILDISIDVTEAAESTQKLEEAQKILEDAVELAQLATWSIDPVNNRTEYSERLQSWLGISESARSMNKGINSMQEHEREDILKALQWAMNPESGGIFDKEYTITNQVSGRTRIVRSQARTFFDSEGKAIKLAGTSQDITEQRNLRLALEHEVQKRTEELDTANEELKATNEELHTVNDELAELIDALGESNDNLQQFAHVASHDLKEPVRKIKTFLGMIESDPETILSSKTRLFLGRVHAATDRMFSMINGVLSYSTLNATGHPIDKVNLQETTDLILHDLEILINQKKATIAYKDLPVIEGAELLLYQLISNLLINSLKFSKAAIPPVILLSASQVYKDNNLFACITVKDNGIGFDTNQSERIFQTFARLHSKDKYEGTGLGLALCQKIARRHGGTIEAIGTPGEGALFTIFLPYRQLQKTI